MANFLITGPDGKQYRVTGDTPEGAVQALQTMQGQGGQTGPADLDQLRATAQERRRQAGGSPAGPRFPGLPVGDAPASHAPMDGLPPLPPGFVLDPPTPGQSTVDMSLDELRSVAQARKARAQASGQDWWKDAPIVKDASGQRYDEGGVPIGGRPMPSPRFPGIPISQGGASASSSATGSGELPPLPPGLELEPEDAPQKFGGAAMNLSAGANESLYGVAGMPVDAMRGAMNLASRGINAVAGTDLPQIPENSFGGSRWIGETMGAIRPELDPQNTEAATSNDRIARGIGQGVAGTVAPAGLAAGLTRAGTLGPQASATAQALFGRAGSGTDAALGAIGGAGAALGQEMAPDGYGAAGSLAGGIMSGGLGAVALGGGRAALAPFTSGGRERLAGQRLVDGASDPARLREAVAGIPDNLVPGSQSTTFQRTGDLGLGVMEKDAANRSPEAFAARRASQNQARVEALRGVESQGAPERVAAVVRQRLDDLDAETERLMGDAMGQARGSVSAMGAPTTPEVAGGSMRQSIEAARAKAKAQERTLWQAVDPDGTMTIGLGGTRESTRGVVAELSPMAQPMTDAERQIYGAIQGAGETIPLRAMRDLQSNLKTAMRAERMANGESPVYRRLAIV